jgi:hypothetical protein
MRTCDIKDCAKPHVAKGLCRLHYSQQNPNHRRMIDYPCGGCGKVVKKEASKLNRYPTLYCTPRCKTDSEWAEKWLAEGATCTLPADHWARWYGKASAWAPPVTERGCDWCATAYTPTSRSHMMCSRWCKRKSSKARRRALERGASGSYTWAEVTRLWISINRCCAYCDEPTSDYEPDHVIPLSKGGSNSITNVVPSCKLCNSDKRDLLLTEWHEDRQRRQLPPRQLNPNLTHLTWAVLAA